MKPKIQKSAIVIGLIDLVLLGLCVTQIFHPLFSFGNFAVLNPAGIIAQKERTLLITAVLLMLIAAIPVYFLIFFFIFKYRADRTDQKYSPDSQSTKTSTFFLWAIPSAIIIALAVINWKSTHDLDPFKAIASNTKPITVQVVALRWKWLFIYPEQNIASVNFVEFPAGSSVQFDLTADDAPMNSFWIPQLGGQMYAMAGMENHLHLLANNVGEYKGGAAEINGAGFAGMKFVAKSVSQTDFDRWVKSVQQSSAALTAATYQELAKPSENNPAAFYSPIQPDLYNQVIIKYLTPY